MLLELAGDALKNKKILEAKKARILCALEVDKQREKTLQNLIFTLHLETSTHPTLKKRLLAHEAFESLANTSAKSTIAAKGSNRRINKIQESAWNGASSYHFFLLSHLQFCNHGTDAAMKTAMICLEHADNTSHAQKEEVLSLVAISSFRNEHHDARSRVMLKLETLEQLQEKKRRACRDLVSHHEYSCVFFVLTILLNCRRKLSSKSFNQLIVHLC